MGEKLNDATAAGTGGGAATATPGGTSTAPGGGTGTEPAPTSEQGSGGGQQADQSGQARWTDDWTDEALAEEADQWRHESEVAQRRIDEAIENGADSETLQELRDMQDRALRMARGHEQTLHERAMARPPASAPDAGDVPERPSAEAQNPDGTRTGVDQEGQGYEVDAEGQRTERERFDQFRTGRGG